MNLSFSFHRDGVPIANRPESGKRPRSEMSPIIALKIGLPNLVIGSPRGSRIIGYVANYTEAHKGWGMIVQAAVSIPHAITRFGTFELEKGTMLVKNGRITGSTCLSGKVA